MLIANRCRVIVWLAGTVGATTIAGCGRPATPPGEPASAATSQKTIAVAVVDDVALAAALRRVKGEWKTQTGQELQVVELDASAIDGQKIEADAVVYPSRLLGTLAEARLIRPLRAEWLKSEKLAAGDRLQPLDAPELVWGGQVYGLSLGSPVFVLLYRADLLVQLGKQPPRTWDEYQALAELLNDRANLKDGASGDLPANWHGTIEPLAPGWAARVLLARVAPYARHREYFSILFNRETMAPLVEGPPYVRALTELVGATRYESDNALQITPAEAYRLIATGQTGMAVCWPTAHALDGAQAAEKTAPIGVAELPGSAEAYNVRRADWEKRSTDEDLHVPLAAIAGRVGSVVRGSDQPDQAFELLAWSASQQWSSELLPASAATTLFRHSHLDDAARWTGQAIDPAAAKDYAAALNHKQGVLVPRLPGEQEYLGALDEAVRAAVSGKSTPEASLKTAAERFNEITDRLGRPAQHEAYRRSLMNAR